MRNRIFNKIISLLLCISCMLQPVSVHAATFSNSYIKEVILSYGDTEKEAKKWLEDNNYKVVDRNINKGADDMVSTKRAVYIGYKTTNDSDEAITDMKLMNMNGNYSVQDYQKILSSQKDTIALYLDDFISALEEYRANYKANKEKAVKAHDMLNLLYDDDTEEYMGDLLLNKIKEEYSTEAYSQLSKEEKNKVADMTTILMQGNSTSILVIEEIIASATDDQDNLWCDRYNSALTYEQLVEQTRKAHKTNKTNAKKLVAAEYDEDAKILASSISDYRDYLKGYEDSGITLESSQEELDAYKNEKGELALSLWYTKAYHYEMLKQLKVDNISLLDLIMDTDTYKVTGKDRYLLYSLLSVLTPGQRACIEFLPFYQIVSMGVNTADTISDSANSAINDALKGQETISIYDGIDRTIFNNDVALTDAAIQLQSSSGKEALSGWYDAGLSKSTKLLWTFFAVSSIISVGSLIGSKTIKASAFFNEMSGEGTYFKQFLDDKDVLDGLTNTFYESNNIKAPITESSGLIEAEIVEDGTDELIKTGALKSAEEADEVETMYDTVLKNSQNETKYGNLFRYIGIATACVTLILCAISIWQTVEDLIKYYNVTYSPIPGHIVYKNESNEFTYYTPVKCNRQEQQMSTDDTKLLKSYGDINGDVGTQWVALYTTKEQAAGYPILEGFTFTDNTDDIEEDSAFLSMFGSTSAENLVNKAYCYDSDGNIYMSYKYNADAYTTGSVFTGGVLAIVGCASMVVCGAATYFIKKKYRREKPND